MNTLKLALAVIAFGLFCSFTSPGPGDDINPETNGAESSATVQYRIQLASYDATAPAEDLKIFEEMEGVTQMTSRGKTVYVTAPYSSEEEASHQLPQLRQQGFKGAKKVVILEDYIVSAKNYHFFYDHKNCSAAEKTKLFETEIRIIRE